MLWVAFGVGTVAAATAATVSVIGGAAAVPALAVLGTMFTVASLLPVLRRSRALVAINGGRRGAERAAEVKRHTSMICR
jgi:hypothetical protein